MDYTEVEVVSQTLQPRLGSDTLVCISNSGRVPWWVPARHHTHVTALVTMMVGKH